MSASVQKKSRSRKSWLVGIWWHGWGDIRDEITLGRNGLKVRSYNVNGGEEAIVSGTHWDGRCLTYKLYWRSTNYKTINKVRPLSKSRAVHTFTTYQTWLKLGPWLLGKKDPFGKSKTKSRRYWLLGDWIDPEFINRNMLSLHIYGAKSSRTTVSIGTPFKVSKIKWDGRVLRFVSFYPNYKPKYLCWAYHEFRPVSFTRAEHAIADNWTFIRCE